jgi:zinc transporter, ZIP family
MSETGRTVTPPRPGWDAKGLALFAFPVLLLAGIIALFLLTNGAGLNVKPAAPLESLTVEQTILRPGEIELHIRNTGPQAITLSTAIVNDAVWPFSIEPGETLPRFGQAIIQLSYPWVAGEPYRVKLFTGNSVAFETEIPAAAETTPPAGMNLLRFTLIGLYVGVIPVLLGICWFPALRRTGQRTFIYLMALTVGLLVFLGIDATSEALEIAHRLGGPFQGVGLVGIGILVTFLLLDAITRWQAGVGRGEADQRLTLAFMIAVGIGLHNLGEGLAIGASYRVGEAALGTFLVIGFILQNITEGLGIIAPVVKDRPGVRRLVWLGLIGGAPAILGAWTGGLTSSAVLAALFLAIGAGAVFGVTYEVVKLIQRQTSKQPMPLTVFAGVTSGMLLLYVTGFLVK